MKFSSRVLSLLFILSFVLAACAPAAPEVINVPFDPDPKVEFGKTEYRPLSDKWQQPEINSITELLNATAQKYNLPADVLAALCWASSRCNETVIGHDGAVGLFQIMPRDGKGAEYKDKKGNPAFANRPSTSELQVGSTNADFMGSFLRTYIDAYLKDHPDSPEAALQYAVYAFGPFTHEYVTGIYAIYNASQP